MTTDQSVNRPEGEAPEIHVGLIEWGSDDLREPMILLATTRYRVAMGAMKEIAAGWCDCCGDDPAFLAEHPISADWDEDQVLAWLAELKRGHDRAVGHSLHCADQRSLWPMTVRPDPHRVQRGHDFWPTPAELAANPALYATDDSGPMADRVVHLHYFAGSSHWWVIEFDPDENVAFGYVILNGDEQSAEWGYIDLDELADLYVAPRSRVMGRRAVWLPIVIERDLYWRPCAARDVLPATACEGRETVRRGRARPLFRGGLASLAALGRLA